MLDGVTAAQALVTAVLGGGLGTTAYMLVKAWRAKRQGDSEDLDAALERYGRRMKELEAERDHYARVAATLRRQLVAAGITPHEPNGHHPGRSRDA